MKFNTTIPKIKMKIVPENHMEKTDIIRYITELLDALDNLREELITVSGESIIGIKTKESMTAEAITTLVCKLEQFFLLLNDDEWEIKSSFPNSSVRPNY